MTKCQHNPIDAPDHTTCDYCGRCYGDEDDQIIRIHDKDYCIECIEVYQLDD